ncbi:hypothetical protein GQ600_27208 [Phytophthora cactorum]|nr:hypothetical protein GQ600_27208 [Phytophthora cactorum]
MNPFAVATIALATVATAAAQDSHSHSSECTAESLTSARNACDSVADVSQIKCDNEACHEALHSLVEDEVRQCYVTWASALSPTWTTTFYSMSSATGTVPIRPARRRRAPRRHQLDQLWHGGTAVGDHDHDHDDHSHDHDHDHSSDDHDESASSSSSSSSASTIAQSLVALQLVAAAVVTLLM